MPPLFAQKKSEEFVSSKLKETRTITIITPASYETSKKNYPLVLLMDGEYLTPPFGGMFSYANYWDDLPEVVLVSIDQNNNGERRQDCKSGEDTGLPEEKGEKFFEFIGMELVPYIEKKYRIAPFKVIAGHDVTAGFLNFFLYKENPMFNAYIAFSPQLPANMEKLLPQRLEEAKKPLFYYLATADGDVGRLKKRIDTLDANIKPIKNTNLRYRFDTFDDASHYSLVARGVPTAMYHIFSSYQPISSAEYQNKLVTLQSGYVKYLEDKYDVIEKDFGIKMPVRIGDFKAVESAILKNGAYDELQDLASLAKKNYPKAIIGEYYTALYQEMKGDIKRAIKTCLNSYTYNEIGDYTKDMMLRKSEELSRIKQ